MSNSELAQSKIERAIFLLINQFGSKSEVVGHLRSALACLGPPVVGLSTNETASTAAAVVEPEAELPTPPPAPRTMGRVRRR